MLVGNKFLFLKIPRTGTTSFERSCFLANIDLKFPTDEILSKKKAAIGEVPLRHSHETVSNIRKTFGDIYPIVAVKRDEIDRFISGWKYCIKELKKFDKEAATILSQIDNKTFIDNWISILGYSADLSKIEALTTFITTLVGRRIDYNVNFYIIFSSVMAGISRWHEDDPNIIYFDFKNLRELEKYVKDTVDSSFELIVSNHTKDLTVALEPTEDLKEFYYKWVDPKHKQGITLI